MAVQVLTTSRCRWAIRVIAALMRKQVSFSVTNVETPDGKIAGFERHTPFGMTPVLVHDERSVPESRVILEYIDEVWPSPALMPGDSLQRAWQRIWMQHCDQALIPALTQVVRSADGLALDEALRRLRRGMALLDDARRTHRPTEGFWAGAQAGLIDYCHFTFFQALRLCGCESAVGLVREFPGLAAWSEAVQSDSVLQRAEAMLDAL